MSAREHGWRSRLADRLTSKRMQERVLLDDWRDLLQAAETLRDCERRHVRDPLKKAAAAVLDQEEKHALGNWGGWFEWLGEFPEECVNFLRLRLALGRGPPEELESLGGLFRNVPGLRDDWGRSRDRPSVAEAWEDAERSDHPAAVALVDLRQRLKALEDLHFSPEDGGSP